MTEREHHTFAELIEGREEEFPTLTRAVQNVLPAGDVRIEWLAYDTAPWFNYQQIFRTSYGRGAPEGSISLGGYATLEEAHGAGLTKFLTRIEQTLVLGVRDVEPQGNFSVRMLGGTRFFLGRDLEATDHISLRPLTEPMLLTIEYDRWGEPLDTPTYEWLCETSLQVNP